MNDFFVLFVCEVCGNEEYFSFDQLPGGEEFCEFCSECGGRLSTGETENSFLDLRNAVGNM